MPASWTGLTRYHKGAAARRILRAYQAPEDGVPTEHVPTRRAAARAKFADVLAPAAVDG